MNIIGEDNVMTRCVLVVLALLSSAGLARSAELKAGAATVDITPPVGHPLWGYAARRDKPSDGILDTLRARALVITVGKESIALVSLDLGRAPTRQSTETIGKR